MGPTMAPPVQLRSFGSLSKGKWCNSAASALFTERPRMDISEHSFKGRNDCMSLLFVAVQFGKLLSARQENLFFFGGGREWNLWPKWHRFKTVWKFDEIVKKNLVRRCKKYQELYTTHIIRQAVAPWGLFLASDRWWISTAPHPSFCWQGASWISGFIWCLVCRKKRPGWDVWMFGWCLMFGIYCPEAWQLENLNLFSNKKEFKWMIASIWIRDSAEVRSFAEKKHVFLVWPCLTHFLL